MSAIILSCVDGLIRITPELEKLGVEHLYFYNSSNKSALNERMVSLIASVDYVVLGDDAGLSPDLAKVVDEAFSRSVPVVTEKCLSGLSKAGSSQQS